MITSVTENATVCESYLGHQQTPFRARSQSWRAFKKIEIWKKRNETMIFDQTIATINANIWIIRPKNKPLDFHHFLVSSKNDKKMKKQKQTSSNQKIIENSSILIKFSRFPSKNQHFLYVLGHERVNRVEAAARTVVLTTVVTSRVVLDGGVATDAVLLAESTLLGAVDVVEIDAVSVCVPLIKKRNF